jgi:DNA-binding response OmpR family regulator
LIINIGNCKGGSYIAPAFNGAGWRKRAMNPTARILLIEDDPALSYATARLLRSAGYTVIVAASGGDGLRLAQEQRPDLILLDVILPDINGIEVCRRVKADPELAGIYVLLLSGFRTSSDDQAEGLELGADGYIVRPIPNRELLARIQTVLRIKRLEEERASLLAREQAARAEADAATRLALIAEAGALMVASLNYPETLENVAHLITAHLADYCIVAVQKGEAAFRTVASHVDPAKQALLRDLLQHWSPGTSGGSAIGQVLGTGRSALLVAVDDTFVHALAAGLEQVGLPESAMIVPLRGREAAIGVIVCLSTEPGRRYSRDDLALAEDLAQRAALAVEHAWLYHEAQEEIAARKRIEQEREELIARLREALAKIRTLRGLLPICVSCKKIRDDTGYWNQLESYLREHSEADFTHGLCPQCAQRLYPDLYEKSQGL